MTSFLIFLVLAIAVGAALAWPLLRKAQAWAMVTAFLLPIATFALYAMIGNPGMPDKPYADRSKDLDFILAATVKETRAKLDKAPTQAGYKSLAQAFYIMKDYDAAAEAFQKAINLGDKSAATLAEMGESLVLANGGTVLPEALGIFYKALKRDPKEARARFYIGVSAAQIGNFKEAVSIWNGVQNDIPQDTPWSGIIGRHIELYAKQGGFDPASVKSSNPSLKPMP